MEENEKNELIETARSFDRLEILEVEMPSRSLEDDKLIASINDLSDLLQSKASSSSNKNLVDAF